MFSLFVQIDWLFLKVRIKALISFKIRTYLFVLSFAMLFSFQSKMVYAQSLDSFVSFSTRNLSFNQIADSLLRYSKYQVVYKKEWVKQIMVSSELKNKPIKELLDEIANQTELSYRIYYNLIIWINKSQITEQTKVENAEPDLIVVGDGSGLKKEIVEVTGKIVDGGLGDPLIGAQFYIKKLQVGAVSDVNGNFKLKLPVERFTAEVSYVGFETKTFPILITSKGNLEIELFSETLQLEEVLVNAQAIGSNVNTTSSGIERMGIETIKKLPTFLGEVDPVKSMVSLPGVSSQGDVSSGYSVRGGDSGQNMIIQDGAIIYNPSHMFGFFSAFNPEIINSMTLIKGGGPANYGGRVSSIMNLRLKNGDTEKFNGSGGLGVASSRLTLEIPLIKQKSSLILSGRASYTEWLLNAVPKVDPSKNKANFYDTFGKYYFKVGEKNQFSISYYRSEDSFRISSDTTNGWQTNNFTFQWDRLLNKNALFSWYIGSSHYQSGTWDDITDNQFSYKNYIHNWQTSISYINSLSEFQKLNLGIDFNYTINSPGELTPASNNIITKAFSAGKQYSLESALYTQYDWDLTPRFSVSAGVRVPLYIRLGPGTIYTFEEPAREPIILDSTQYNSMKPIVNYIKIEPRISFRYMLTASSSVKLAYNRTNQFMHLVSNTVSMNPLDYWLASGKQVKPQQGDQFSMGYFKNSEDNEYELSAEVYYKSIQNTIDYIEGAKIEFNNYIESNLIQGLGRSYGIEVMLKKNTGKLNGWLSYTYSRSLKQFNSTNEVATINNGNFYPANTDKPNDFSAVLSYAVGGRVVFSANFVYSTGRPITLPISKFQYDKKLSILTYSNRNEYRMPDYHRLDLSITLKEGLKKNLLVKGEWVISLFNVYARKNVYNIFFNDRGVAYKMSVLGTVFPSISYNFKF